MRFNAYELFSEFICTLYFSNITFYFNFKYPEFIIGFRWVLRARRGYKFDARVTKATNMMKTVLKGILVVIEKVVILDWNIGFLNAIFSMNFE